MLPEKIIHNGKIHALIIRSHQEVTGVEFYTHAEDSQQLGAMGHPKGKKILPHIHLSVERAVVHTQETLFLKKGKLRVDFYNDEKNLFHSTVLGPLDIILLTYGGHGFEVLEDVQMVEVKQGPYTGLSDKTRFSSHLLGSD